MKYDAIIIDGKNLLYRVAHVYAKQSIDYQNIMVKGFLQCCFGICKKWSKRLFFAWEGEGNFRKELFRGYKAKGEPSEELAFMLQKMQGQEKKLKRILSMLGWEQYSGFGGEGDDVIGYLAFELRKKFKRVAIYSNDSDLRQLIKDSVHVLASKSGKEVIYDEEAAMREHGVSPSLIPSLKALTGDKSDCIPGVGGVGPVKASCLLQTYGDLEEVIEAAVRHSKDWPSSVGEKVREQIEKNRLFIRRNLLLTTIREDPTLVKKFFLVEKDFDSLLAFIHDLGLHSIIVDLEAFRK